MSEDDSTAGSAQPSPKDMPSAERRASSRTKGMTPEQRRFLGTPRIKDNVAEQEEQASRAHRPQKEPPEPQPPLADEGRPPAPRLEEAGEADAEEAVEERRQA